MFVLEHKYSPWPMGVDITYIRSFLVYCPLLCVAKDSFCQGPIVSLGNCLSILSGGCEVVLQWEEEVTYHKDNPCPPKQLVSPMTTKVGNNPIREVQ